MNQTTLDQVKELHSKITAAKRATSQIETALWATPDRNPELRAAQELAAAALRTLAECHDEMRKGINRMLNTTGTNEG